MRRRAVKEIIHRSLGTVESNRNLPEPYRPDHRPQQTGKNPVICYYCGKKGHFAKDCRKKKQAQERRGNKEKGIHSIGGEDSGQEDIPSTSDAKQGKEEREVDRPTH